MCLIAKEHGLVPIPVDFDFDTHEPIQEQIEAAISEKTVAMIFVYLGGVTYDIAPYAEFFKSRNIDLIEDCAQSFKSVESFLGSPHATMTMFSFGFIKFNTAFYGAATVIREQNNVASMPKSAGL